MHNKIILLFFFQDNFPIAIEALNELIKSVI